MSDEPAPDDDVIVVREAPHGALTWRWAKDGPKPGDVVYVPASRLAEAEATIARVEALADFYWNEGAVGGDETLVRVAETIRAALDGER